MITIKAKQTLQSSVSKSWLKQLCHHKPPSGLQGLHTDSFKSCLQECEALATVSVGFSVRLHEFIQLGWLIQLKEMSGQQGYVVFQLDAVLQKKKTRKFDVSTQKNKIPTKTRHHFDRHEQRKLLSQTLSNSQPVSAPSLLVCQKWEGTHHWPCIISFMRELSSVYAWTWGLVINVSGYRAQVQ